MSKWKLLKHRLTGKDKNTSKIDELSIHRHNGFQFFSSKRTIFIWKDLQTYTINEDTVNNNINDKKSDWLNDLIDYYYKFMEIRDCSECCMNIEIPLKYKDELYNFLQAGDEAKTHRFDPLEIDLINKKVKTTFYVVQNPSIILSMSECIYKKYIININTDNNNNNWEIYTREGIPDRKLTIKDITSHEDYGVDNTGNIRIWDSESILLYTLLKIEKSIFNNNKITLQQNLLLSYIKDQNILELGGGLTALCGLGIAATSYIKPKLIIITDGHPKCTRNLQVCIEMNKQKQVFNQCDINAHQLRWDRNDIKCQNEINSILNINNNIGYDTILISDCLFFKEFHLDLIYVLNQIVRPGGRVLLLQPPRSGSTELFIKLINKNVWEINREFEENYCEEVNEKHKKFMNEDIEKGIYDPDLHFPRLLIMIKKDNNSNIFNI